MQADVDTLSAEYGRMARAALREGFLNDRLAFLITSESFSEALARTRYLRQYDENRGRQLELIQLTREVLQNKVDKLDDIRAEKEKLLGAELTQQNILEESLANDEDRLRKELKEQTRDKNQLDRAIGDVITRSNESRDKERLERERIEAKALVAERNRSADKATKTVVEPAKPKAAVVTSENYGTALSQDFIKNRGKLPWPVEGGFISKPYGERAHPTLSKVKVRNNGVDIRTDPGSTVKAIFEGEVVGLQAVPGYNYMVILQHGDYFSVYSNLVDVRVKAGARVGTADVIGAVATNATTNTSELHFEVWKERQTQNPAAWLKR
jgi:septal ring factor EnvC (AmiA/AmiB activator)